MTVKMFETTRTTGVGVPRPVLGIGASAGGLDACRELLSKLPADAGLAVVLVVHLQPDHQSIMAELLAKDSSMPVEQACDGPIRPNRVYVVPPNVTLALVAGCIKLRPLKRGDRLTRIDSFLGSLAADQGESAVGMILTGMGSDGTLGLPDGMDGYELIKRIKSWPALGELPVIAMSGYGLAEDRARSQAAGFSAHLNKPFDLEDVHRCLRALPRPDGAGGPPGPATEPNLGAALRRVLVIDDNFMIAGSLTKMLTKVGMVARFACSAADALKVAKKLRPQIALLDLGLPGRSGYELKDDLAEMAECQGCLFLAITGSDAPEDKERTRRAGFVAHLTKPVSLEELVLEIDLAVQRWAQELALG